MKLKCVLGEGGRKNESKSRSTHEQRPPIAVIKSLPVFGESETAPSSVAFYTASCILGLRRSVPTKPTPTDLQKYRLNAFKRLL